jgi:hypothetical protein
MPAKRTRCAKCHHAIYVTFEGAEKKSGNGARSPESDACLLILQSLQLGRIRHFHAAILGFEFIKCALAETVLAADLFRRHPGFLFFDHPDDLRFCKTALSHLFAPSRG